MAKVAGTAFFKINGNQYSLRGNMRVSLGKFERESVVGMDKYHGIKEMPRACYIECDLTDRPDIDLKDLENLEGVSVTVELNNGKVGLLKDATQVKQIELDAEEGKCTVRFESGDGEWIS